MSELLDIIISAVDNASDVIDGIGDTARDTAEAIQDSFTGDSFDEMTSALEEANNEVERLEEELAAIYMGDIEGDAEAVEAALAAAQEEAQKLADALKEADDNGDELEDSVNSIESLMAFQEISGYVTQLADAMWEVTDKAGMVQDSWDRLGLAADGAGIPINGMKDSVSRLSDETGRAGGDIREAFISMSGAGIESLGTMETLFKGAAAQAYIHGTSVDALANKYTGMAMRSRVAERTLKDTGITVEDLGEAMGMQGATIDEINEKWESLSVDQRANILGTAALMDEGKDANDAYKTSWEGLQAQIDIAKGKLEVLVGKVFLPVVIPILQVAGRVLDWLGDTISGVMDGPFGTLISVVGSAGGALVLLLAGITAITAAMPFLTMTLWPAVAASWALLAPWLPWIALGAAIVAIIYEIGKAFGWWSDASSMIDAIWAGILRLWDAFINHPDVQAALQAISDALAWIWDGLQQAGQAVLEFLGVSTSGDFDIVAAIIQSIGQAWDIITAPIRFVIGLFIQAGEAGAAVGDAIGDMWNNTMGPFGEWLSSVFGPIWDAFGQAFENIKPYVDDLTKAFDDFKNGQLDIPGLVSAVVMAAWNAWTTFVGTMSGALLEFAGNLWNGAYTAGANFLSGIVTWFSQIPGRVWSYLSRTSTNIGNNLHQWVTTARNRAMAFVTGIITRLSQLPGRVASALASVVGTIRTAIQNWINTAKSKVTDLINDITKPFSNVGSTISSNLSDVTSAITKPFSKAYDDLVGIVDKIKNKASEVSGFAFGGETAYGGETSTASYSVDNSPIEVNQNLTLDFKNVPSHLDTNQLINALTEPSVLQALTGNSDFQAMDGRVKQRLQLKMNRSRGI